MDVVILANLYNLKVVLKKIFYDCDLLLGNETSNLPSSHPVTIFSFSRSSYRLAIFNS